MALPETRVGYQVQTSDWEAQTCLRTTLRSIKGQYSRTSVRNGAGHRCMLSQEGLRYIERAMIDRYELLSKGSSQGLNLLAVMTP